MPPQERGIFHMAVFHFQTWPGCIFITLDLFFQPRLTHTHHTVIQKKEKKSMAPVQSMMEKLPDKCVPVLKQKEIRGSQAVQVCVCVCFHTYLL